VDPQPKSVLEIAGMEIALQRLLTAPKTRWAQLDAVSTDQGIYVLWVQGTVPVCLKVGIAGPRSARRRVTRYLTSRACVRRSSEAETHRRRGLTAAAPDGGLSTLILNYNRPHTAAAGEPHVVGRLVVICKSAQCGRAGQRGML
jgi:hypothetical protein